jgi:hypothetical protein
VFSPYASAAPSALNSDLSGRSLRYNSTAGERIGIIIVVSWGIFSSNLKRCVQ